MKRVWARRAGSLLLAALAVAAAGALRAGLDRWGAAPPAAESQREPAATAEPAPAQALPQPDPTPAPTAAWPAAGRATAGATPAPTADPLEAAPQGWLLRLAKPGCPLPEEFTVELADVAGGRFDARAAGELERMFADAKAAGCPLTLVCGYRSREDQQNLYEQKTRQLEAQGMAPARAAEEAARWTPPGGCSEHELGLGADILPAAGMDAATLAWLEANAAEYGFVLRYPEGKEAVTGMAPMSWHYRYVGPEAAAAMAEQGWCLEEYRENIGQYGGRQGLRA